MFLPKDLEYTIPENAFMPWLFSIGLKCSRSRFLTSTFSPYCSGLPFLPVLGFFEMYDKCASSRSLLTRWRSPPRICSTKLFLEKYASATTYLVMDNICSTCFLMAAAYQSTSVKPLSWRQLVGGVCMASRWKLNLVSALITQSLRISIPLSALPAHPDQKYPIPGVCLPDLWIKLGSKAVAFRVPIQGSDKNLLKRKKPNPFSDWLRKRCSPKRLYRPYWRKLIFAGMLKYNIKISIIKSRLHLLSFILETDKASLTILEYKS